MAVLGLDRAFKQGKYQRSVGKPYKNPYNNSVYAHNSFKRGYYYKERLRAQNKFIGLWKFIRGDKI